MSVNYRVTKAAEKCGEALCKGRAEYLKARENYFKVIEEELRKEPANGWIDWEDPTDTLIDYMVNDESSDVIADILDEYIQFFDIIEKVTGEDRADSKLIRQAIKYIRKNK